MKKSRLKNPHITQQVLRVACNEGRTTDGVAAGATRVAAEVNAFVRAHRAAAAATAATAAAASAGALSGAGADAGAGAASAGASVAGAAGRRHLASISFVGHSLGGLYARLAAALLFGPVRGTKKH